MGQEIEHHFVFDRPFQGDADRLEKVFERPAPPAKGADVAIGPLTRDAGTRLAFIRGPEGIMVELVQQR